MPFLAPWIAWLKLYIPPGPASLNIGMFDLAGIQLADENTNSDSVRIEPFKRRFVLAVVVGLSSNSLEPWYSLFFLLKESFEG